MPVDSRLVLANAESSGGHNFGTEGVARRCALPIAFGKTLIAEVTDECQLRRAKSFLRV